MISKKELRQQYRTILHNLDQRWVAAASHRLCRKLDEFFIDRSASDIKHILSFSSFFAGEADLTAFITNQIGNRKVYLPRLGADTSMVYISLSKDWQQQSTAGDFGIPEPTGGEIYDPSNAHETAVLVPGLVFDTQGNRLGRGKGYYDRFLQKRENQGMHVIGITWDLQILTETVPTEPHDIMMNWVVSEERIVRC